jgi:hypothetical protein
MDEFTALFSRKDMTFEEAVEYFKERVPVTASRFYQIAAEYRALAFTVSGYTKAQVLKKFYDELLAALEEGNSLAEFRENMNDFLEAEGYEGITPYQAENIFRTNIQTAYNVGHYKQMTEPGVNPPEPPCDGWARVHGGRSHLGHMVPAQRLQVPLHGQDALQAPDGAAGADGGDRSTEGGAAGGWALRQHPARPAVRYQPRQGTLSARPHRLPRATQKGVPRARKEEHSAIRPQSPAVRVLLSAG